MSKWKDVYNQKLMTPKDAAMLVKSGNYIAFGEAITGPTLFPEEMVRRKDLKDVHICESVPLYPCSYLKPENTDRFHPVSWFLTELDRPLLKNGQADFIHHHFSQHYSLQKEYFKYDIFVCQVAPMNENGYFSLCSGAGANRSRMNCSKCIIFEVNPNMPTVYGDCMVHISEVDGIIESQVPIHELYIPKINEKDRAIGKMIAELVPDGACIQLGIGGIPNAVAESLRNKKHLGIHSEMISENMMDLMERGVVDNSMKKINRGKSVGAFVWGSRKLYDFCDHNPNIEFYPYEYTNDPFVISQNDNMISVNACMEVDFIGQACSESIGPNEYSGTGGQFDFVYGASRSKGGKSFLTMYSTAKNDTISKIRPFLHEGAVVTTPKNDIDYVVTEYGAARLRGKTVSERTKALISIAHPKFRQELLEQAKELKFIK